MRGAVLLVLVMLGAGCASQTAPLPPSTSTAAAPAPLPPLRLSLVADGFAQPVDLVEEGGRFFVVEQGGLVKTLDGNVFFDGTALTDAGGERGFFKLAFDPAHADRMLFSYTDTNGDSVIERYRFEGDRVDPSSAERIFFLHQPFANHNGGDIVFGPDGLLYAGYGDGGSGGDPEGNGQNAHALLGSLLRFDLRGATVPEPEIFAKGLRNPWRFSFDRATGDLWIADVGQGSWEEVDYARNGTGAGRNYGWNAFEGKHAYDPGTRPFSDVTAPVAEYSHDDGSCSITGGFVYRGAAIPALVGTYLYGDYCSGKLYGLRVENGSWTPTRLLETGLNIASFGEDAAGEIDIVDHGGGIYRIERA